MNKYGYLDILKINLKESAVKLGLGVRFIFQQDNDAKHTAEIVKQWLLYSKTTSYTPAITWPQPNWTLMGPTREKN